MLFLDKNEQATIHPRGAYPMQRYCNAKRWNGGQIRKSLLWFT